MAEEKVAVVRHLIEATNRANDEGADVRDTIARISDLLDPGVEYVNPPEAVERGTRRGIEGMTEVMTSMRESLGTFHFELSWIEEHGDAVALRCRLHAAGPSSGVRVEGPWLSQLYVIAGDRITRIKWFLDPDEAFSRLGIESDR